jgi:anti-sigma B factor antagonist
MEISSEKLADGIMKIQLSGRMDMQGTAAIETKFTAYAVRDNGAVVVDMSAVSFLASIGIRTLILSAKALQHRGGKIALFKPDAGVRKVLEMAGVDSLIPVCDSMESACLAVTA